eukprot:TRINITY_DN4874_c0_g1_i1.p2 TRINITY_DN4874_c0_g1~~TRINITY_DN4874_c0_g1_i1.p2  ORF type:complete len:269 (-),score=59.15 TRINITY_DN4874_c0_g1_i1:59-865(-)
MLVFAFFLAFAFGDTAIPCTVSKNELTWDFTPFKGTQLKFVTDRYNFGPMVGPYTYSIDFCKNLSLSKDGFGWDYGELTIFSPHTHYIPPLDKPYHIAFEMEYGFGDSGPPCVDRDRAAITELFCDSALDCTRFPGNIGSGCIAGSVDNLCVCGANFTVAEVGVSPLCQGLVIYLLSHNCVNPGMTPINPPGPQPTPDEGGNNTAGIVIGVLVALFVAAYFGAAGYKYFVQGERGVLAFPFASSCFGAPTTVGYEEGTGATKGGYGSL